MNPVKTMYSITLHERGHVLDIDVIGDGFLYHMVRNIAGGLVDLGLHRLTPERFREISPAATGLSSGRRHRPRAYAWRPSFMMKGS